MTASLTPWLGRFAALLMLALLAWLGAGIFWTLSAPETSPPPMLPETDPQRAAQASVARHLFGIAPIAAAAADAGAPADIRLNGAISAQHPGQRAYALLVVEGKPPQLVREGDEVVAGIVLQRVMPRQVELLRGGRTQLLTLPERGKP